MPISLYRNFALPVLQQLDPETAHERVLSGLEFAQASALGRWALQGMAGETPGRAVDLFGLRFPNVLGIAAGLDKDARVAPALGELGFGHIEVGTLTPRPQEGNPRPRIFRLSAERALVNRMGFPNGGIQAALPRLRAIYNSRRDFVLGVSLGKQKETRLADAAADYIAVMREAHPFADYLAVNISSPNTPGLRELQGGRYLPELLRALAAENESLARAAQIARRPLLVKIAPDLADAELDEALEAIQGAGIDGVIATNTTLSRDGVSGPLATEAGGLSGRPLRDRSTRIVDAIFRRTGGKLPIVGVGGIDRAADVEAKLDAGASLVQLYTGLIYQGPGLAGKILRTMYPADAEA